MASTTLTLVDRILAGGLAEYLTDARAAGHSFERISKMLYEDHAIDVTGETVRKWSVELGVPSQATAAS